MTRVPLCHAALCAILGTPPASGYLRALGPELAVMVFQGAAERRVRVLRVIVGSLAGCDDAKAPWTRVHFVCLVSKVFLLLL